MPLVFVHGVNVRRGSQPKEQQAFDQRVKARDALFRAVSFADRVKPPAVLAVQNPYWGDLAAKFAWNLASVPVGDTEALGSSLDEATEEGRLAQVVMETATPRAARRETNAFLLDLARSASLGHAVDAAVAGALSIQRQLVGNSDPKNEEWGQRVAHFAALASAYAEANPKPPWLTDPAVTRDAAFLDRLTVEVENFQSSTAPPVGVPIPPPADETLGFDDVLDHLKRAATRLGNAAKGVLVPAVDHAAGEFGHLVAPAVSLLRPGATALLGRFFGDIFVYLKHRGPKDAPGMIVRTVINALDAAITAKADGDNDLYIVAHSMGGNIIYDVLTFYRPDIVCDVLVTVGSQIGLLEEIKFFNVSDDKLGAATNARVKRPDNIKRWLNIYDPTDIVGFATEGVFEGVTDRAFDNKTLPVLSHSFYFERPRFHARLHACLAGPDPAVKSGAQG